MKIINFEKKNKLKIETPSVVTIGNFDGVHLGHQKILKSVINENKDLIKGVVTFKGIENLKNTTQIYQTEEKLDLLEKMGFDFVIVIDIKKIISMEAKDFTDLLLEHANIKKIVIGKNFRFGKNRKGDFRIFEHYSNIEVKRYDLVKNNNAIISSSLIRSLLDEGSVLKASELLGRKYSIKGRVYRGNQMGKKLNAPTANIEVNINEINLKDGIYLSYAILDNVKYPSITSIGTKPTLTKNKRIWYETHILNFDKDIYDQIIKVEFIDYIRETKKFLTIEILKEAIQKDKQYAIDYFLNKQKKINK